MAQLGQFQQLMARESSTTQSAAALRERVAPVLLYSHCFATRYLCGVYETRALGYSNKETVHLQLASSGSRSILGGFRKSRR
jgi:hypothetical protein